MRCAIDGNHDHLNHHERGQNGQGTPTVKLDPLRLETNTLLGRERHDGTHDLANGAYDSPTFFRIQLGFRHDRTRVVAGMVSVNGRQANEYVLASKHEVEVISGQWLLHP